MASRFFVLFDDIAILMDDVAVMSKLATKKTAGILADDLAVNAEKASGFVSAREIPVLWKITKGSLLNKIIILPVVFLLSAYFPVAIVPILLIGGLYLSYEGAEKIYEYLFHKKDDKKDISLNTEMTPAQIEEYEKEKIKSAIIVDFILSVEIIIIALSTITDSPLNIRIIVVTIVALIATVFVYGLVALLVRMDDLGYNLIAKSKTNEGILNKIGTALVKTLPFIVRSLGVIGTFAMILVAGGIFVHNIEHVHHLVESLPLPSIVSEFIIGLIIGFICLFITKIVLKVIGKND
ncbi:DUF808 domain-containing protein [Bernardetia sp. ABR2-2B]|uniref:DUF808 domain-containing protein n=1 Tax=Bernardetia sp. ABR2-2B TaxID=3127472 RepID=UPI0030CC6548